MNYYWEIEQYDGTTTLIPPEAVEVVKRRWKNKEPIHTTNESINPTQIKSFHVTARRYSNVPLLESAAQAFDEPMLTEDGAVQSKWVKKRVPGRIYSKYYAGVPAYRHLEDEEGMVVVAFRLPVHQINTQTVDECNLEEIKRLTKD